MSPFVFRHSSSPKNREWILRTGLEPRRPIEHNYVGQEYLHDQPIGVYVTPADLPAWQDQWDQYTVTYLGPLMNDPCFGAGNPAFFVLLEHVPPENLTLETPDTKEES